MRRLRGNRIGVWLGVLAVAFYAWLPHHFAIDVVHAAVHAEAHRHATTADASDHHGHDPADHNDHHRTCPICAAAAASATPAAAMLPILAQLSAPRSTAASVRIAEATANFRAASLTPYAPRGPPSAIR